MAGRLGTLRRKDVMNFEKLNFGNVELSKRKGQVNHETKFNNRSDVQVPSNL